MKHDHDKNKTVPTCNACIMRQYFSTNGKKGGNKTKEKGHAHYVMIGKKGGRPRKSDSILLVDKSKPTSL